MQKPISCKLSDISREQWQYAFDRAMAATDFDGLFHRLYLAFEPKWYTGPDSARELANILFADLIKNISCAILTDQQTIASGFLKLELSVYPDNFQCHIRFDAVTAHGYGVVYR